jgi:hypothetical protein
MVYECFQHLYMLQPSRRYESVAVMSQPHFGAQCSVIHRTLVLSANRVSQSVWAKQLTHWMDRLHVHVLWGAVKPTQNEKSHLGTHWWIMRRLSIAYFNNLRQISRHSYVPSSVMGINITDNTWRIFVKFGTNIMPKNSTQWWFYSFPWTKQTRPQRKYFVFSKYKINIKNAAVLVEQTLEMEIKINRHGSRTRKEYLPMIHTSSTTDLLSLP